MNYFLGQINIVVSFFILISLFYFLKNSLRYDILGCLFLGLGIAFKPSLMLLLPFILLLNYNRQTNKMEFQFKRTIIRLFGTILPIILSGLLFAIYPVLIIVSVNGYSDASFIFFLLLSLYLFMKSLEKEGIDISKWSDLTTQKGPKGALIEIENVKEKRVLSIE